MSNVKLSDIITAIPALTENGSNWSIFKMRFRLALTPYGLYHHFVPNSKNLRPWNPIPYGTTTPTEEQTKLKEQYDLDFAKWEKNDDTA